MLQMQNVEKLQRLELKIIFFFCPMSLTELDPQLKRCDHLIDDIICEAIGLNKKICFDEFIRVAEFNANFPIKRFRTEEAEHLAMRLNYFYKYVKIFTADAGNQWFEITNGIWISKLNPVWFSGHKVYEIPVKAGLLYVKSIISLLHFNCPDQSSAAPTQIAQLDRDNTTVLFVSMVKTRLLLDSIHASARIGWNSWQCKWRRCNFTR